MHRMHPGAEMPESRMRGMQDDDADAALRPSAEEKENEITPFIHGWLAGLRGPSSPVLGSTTRQSCCIEFGQFPSAGAIVWITFYRTVDWPSTALPIPPHPGKTSDAIPRMAHL